MFVEEKYTYKLQIAYVTYKPFLCSQALVALSMSACQRSGRHVEYKLNHITTSQQAPLEVSRRITWDELIRSHLSARWEGC